MDFLAAQNRARFLEIWKNTSENKKLEGEEAVFGRIMQEHPEFHATFNLGEPAFGIDFASRNEVNPFLHISLHAVVEQQIADRNPAEVEQAYQAILEWGDSRHESIHRISGILAEVLFEAIQKKSPIDDAGYLRRVRELIK